MIPNAPAEIVWGLPPPRLKHQAETFNSRAKFTLQSGAYGSGKTNTNAWIVLREAIEYPNNLVLMGAETVPQLRETLQADFDKLIGDLTARGLVKYSASQRSYSFWNGSKVLAWALVGSDAERQRLRLRSLNLGAAVIEEVLSIPRETVLEVQGRLRRPSSSRRMTAGCNPGSPEHYLYEIFVRDPLPGHRLIKSNTYANPFLPPDYVKSLEQTLDPDMKQRYVDGEWVNFHGLVYKGFLRETHVVTPEFLEGIEVVDRWAALDFGGANPHCILWFAEDARGYIYITAEWYAAQEPLSEVARMLKSDPVSPVYCDHDATDRLTLERDFEVRGLRSAKKDKMRGIAKIQEYLKPVAEGLPPRLRVSNKCKSFIKEIGNYKWPKGTNARDPNNEPVKKDDHAMDTMRYGIFTRAVYGGGAILQGG